MVGTHSLCLGSVLMGLHCRAGLALALQTHLHVGGLEAAHLSHCRMAQGVWRILHRRKS